jgi:glycosyltransferase involved in cell wall biosynthesis
VFNGARFVADAVASVRAQGWPALELIAVDDGSTDTTPEILAALAADPGNRLCVVRTENHGPATARNHALSLARGEFIAFIDADDLWPEGKLEAQMRRFAERPELEVCYGLVRVRDLDGHTGASSWMRDGGVPVVLPNIAGAVVRADTFERVGMFDPALVPAEDIDWMIRALEAKATVTVLNRVTLIYRHHDANLTGDRGRFKLSTLIAIRRSLARRRSLDAAVPNLPQLSDFLEKAEPGR